MRSATCRISLISEQEGRTTYNSNIQSESFQSRLGRKVLKLPYPYVRVNGLRYPTHQRTYLDRPNECIWYVRPEISLYRKQEEKVDRR